MAPVPVFASRSRSEQGSYHFASRPTRPVKIVISRFARHPSWTLLHELGHLLDNVVLNSSNFDFGTPGGARFRPLLAAWKIDARVRTLHQLLLRRGHIEPVAARRTLRYELSAAEIWARTCVQWITAKSLHPVLIRNLGERRETPLLFAGVPCVLDGDDQEFEGIMSLVDEIMSEAGLL